MNAPHPSGLTCIHADIGLCPQCQTDYDADPQAYVEYGHHPEGVAAWEALQREMLGEPCQQTEGPRDDISF